MKELTTFQKLLAQTTIGHLDPREVREALPPPPLRWRDGMLFLDPEIIDQAIVEGEQFFSLELTRWLKGELDAKYPYQWGSQIKEEQGGYSPMHMFGLGEGWLSASAAKIAKAHGAVLINHTDPECRCGRGCRLWKCRASRRHWFECRNLGEPFDSRRERVVFEALAVARTDAGCLKNT